MNPGPRQLSVKREEKEGGVAVTHLYIYGKRCTSTYIAKSSYIVVDNMLHAAYT